MECTQGREREEETCYLQRSMLLFDKAQESRQLTPEEDWLRKED
jgi:hypothetical protein